VAGGEPRETRRGRRGFGPRPRAKTIQRILAPYRQRLAGGGILGGVFAAGVVQRPLSLDAAPSGRVAVLDRDGARLLLAPAGGGALLEVELPGPARCVRFFGEYAGVLAAGHLWSFDPAGERVGEMALPEEASCLAATPSGSLLVSAGRTLHRLGDDPVSYDEEQAIAAVAAHSGGVWLATARDAVRLRPRAGGYDVAERHRLPGAARALALGPDAVPYIALDDAVLRLGGDPEPVDGPVEDLARVGGRMWGAEPSGLVDYTRLVPRPTGDHPMPELPACDDDDGGA